MQKNKTDIKENYLYAFNSGILKILLMDRTTRKNIIWATDNYPSSKLTTSRLWSLTHFPFHGCALLRRREKPKRIKTTRVT